MFSSIQLGFSGIFRAKIRSILTIIAIYIGAGAVMGALLFAAGLEAQIRTSTEVIIGESNPIVGYPLDIESELSPQKLTTEDVEKITAIPGVEDVLLSNLLQRFSTATVIDDETTIDFFTLESRPQERLSLAAGNQPKRTGDVVVGYSVATSYNEDITQIIGKSFTAEMIAFDAFGNITETSNFTLQVTGVLREDTVLDFRNIYSYTTEDVYLETFENGKTKAEFFAEGVDFAELLYANPGDIESVRQTESEVENLGYDVISTLDVVDEIEQVILIIRLLLVAAAGVVVVTAFFGVMNTLLMSVLERTREIGVMKTVGATFMNIFTMFSFEGIFLGLIGSVAGIVTAWLISIPINLYIQNLQEQGEFINDLLVFRWIDAFGVILGICFVCFIAATLPAIRAARINPVDALRGE